MEFVKSQTWCQDMALINGVLRPEGPLLPAQAVMPGGQDGPIDRDPGLTAWAG